jgi:hypothetical protein
MPSQLVSGPAVEPVTLTEAKAHLREIDSTQDALIGTLISAARLHAETVCRRAFINQQWKMTADRFPSPMAGKLNEYWIGQQWGLSGQGSVSQFFPTDRSGYAIVVPWSTLISVDSIKYRSTVTESGTAASATSSTITLGAGASTVDNFYSGAALQIASGTGLGQYNVIISYVGATKVATVSPWATVPDATSQYLIAGILTTLSSAVYVVDNVSEPARITPNFGNVWPTTLQRINAAEVTFTVGYGADETFVPAGIKHWILMRVATLYENREAVAVLGRGGKVDALPFVDDLLLPYRVLTV